MEVFKMSRRLKWSLISAAAIVAITIIIGITSIVLFSGDNTTAKASEENYDTDTDVIISAVLPELEKAVDTFVSTDPMIGQELVEISVLQMMSAFKTMDIELQAIKAPNESDHGKLLEIVRAGKSECGKLAKEYERGNFEADPEPCLNAFKELKRFSEK